MSYNFQTRPAYHWLASSLSVGLYVVAGCPGSYLHPTHSHPLFSIVCHAWGVEHIHLVYYKGV